MLLKSENLIIKISSNSAISYDPNYIRVTPSNGMVFDFNYTSSEKSKPIFTRLCEIMHGTRFINNDHFLLDMCTGIIHYKYSDHPSPPITLKSDILGIVAHIFPFTPRRLDLEIQVNGELSFLYTDKQTRSQVLKNLQELLTTRPSFELNMDTGEYQ